MLPLPLTSSPPVCLMISLIILTAAVFVSAEETPECVRRPLETTAQQTEGSNGFHLVINKYPSEDETTLPDGYKPGERYTVTLEGFKTQYTVQTFRGFSMVAVSSQDSNQPVGKLKILNMDNMEVKHSPDCDHAVTHTSLYPKTSITVMWEAPDTNQGCVDFRAMVLEYRDIWYMDDGPLTHRFCQLAKRRNVGYESEVNDDDECCACDEASYEIKFHGIWSRQTHPKDFPRIEQLTHFSDIIGASHTANYTMWDYGEISTDGMKELAEWGNTVGVEEEIKQQGANIRTIIKTKGLWYPNVQGTATAIFRVDKMHHLLSAASMFGPSPDWAVGISRVNLCLKDCSWVTERNFDLYPWDAGTDRGSSYMSPNSPTETRVPISKITTHDPPGSPFYNDMVDVMPPLAKMSIRLQKVYPSECKNDAEYLAMSPFANGNTGETSEDLVYKDKPECAVRDWTQWSSCSATCGKGIRMRSRSYIKPHKAQIGGCKRQMIEKQFCNAEVRECINSEVFNDMCQTTPWSMWTDCSVTCGGGHRSRSREYQSAMSNKLCHLELLTTETCDGVHGEDCTATPHPNCKLTDWSEWSPCSVSCGQGTRARQRLPFDNEAASWCGDDTRFRQTDQCESEYKNCNKLVYQMRQEVCVEPKEPGACSGIFPRYYFDVGSKTCRRFIYTGCKGNNNNFESENQCMAGCLGPGAVEGMVGVDAEHVVPAERYGFHTSSPTSQVPYQRISFVPIPLPNHAFLTDKQINKVVDSVTEKIWSKLENYIDSRLAKYTNRVHDVANGALRDTPDIPIDCVMTLWSEWSSCSSSCGLSYKVRTRGIKTPQRNGGHACPVNNRENIKCRMRPCPYHRVRTTPHPFKGFTDTVLPTERPKQQTPFHGRQDAFIVAEPQKDEPYNPSVQAQNRFYNTASTHTVTSLCMLFVLPLL